MTNLRKGCLARLLAVGLVLTLYVLPGVGSAAVLAAAKTQPAAQPTLTLAVLPFDKKAQGGTDDMGRELAAAVKASLEVTGKFYVVGFSDRLPSIQRAVAEGTLSKREVEGPFAGDKAVAARIGRALGANVVVTGSIDEIKTDLPNSSVEITANVQMIDVQNAEVLKSVVLTGMNTTKPEGAPEDQLVSLAMLDLAGKITKEVVGDAKGGALASVEKQMPVAPAPAKKKSKGLKYLLLLLLVGAGVALAGGGSDHKSSSTSGDDGPPAPP